MVDEDAEFRIRGFEFAAWMRMIDRESEWLVDNGRMPPQGTGCAAVEAQRWRIYPVYDTGTAAKLLQIEESDLFDAVETGELEYVSHYGLVMVPFSGLVAFCARRPPLSMPAGGGWDDLAAGEWWEWHWRRTQRLRGQFRGDAKRLQLAEEALARDERLYLESRASRRALEGDGPHRAPAVGVEAAREAVPRAQ